MCSAMPSPTIWPTVMRGLSDANGSWNTTCMRRRIAAQRRAIGAVDAGRVHLDAAGGDGLQCQQRHPERRLARARFADDAERLATLELERRIAHGNEVALGEPACGGAELDPDVLRRHQRRRIGRHRLHDTLRTAREQLLGVGVLRIAEHLGRCRRISTSRPRSITPTRWVKRRTRFRSCVMNSSAMPISRCSSSSSSQDLRLDRHVERRRRFVGDQELRPAGERHRDHRALPLPARHLVRVGVDAALGLGDAGPCKQVDGARTRLVLAQPLVQLQHLADLVAHRVERVQRRHRLLEDHADRALRGCRASRARSSSAGRRLRSGSRRSSSRHRRGAAPTAR